MRASRSGSWPRLRLMALVCTSEINSSAAADGDLHAVVDDLLGGGGDRHQAGGALAIDRHAGDAVRQAGAQGGLAREVEALRALLQRRAHHDVLDLRRIDPGTLDRLRDDMATERLALGVVERAAIGAADGRAGGGDDDGAAHPGVSFWLLAAVWAGARAA